MAEKQLGPYETVELQLATKGTDLWAAIEAAQYARTVTYDAPANDEETAAMTRFVEFFTRSAEGWEKVPMNAKAAALDKFARHLGDLRRLGLFVHCGTIERTFALEGHEPKILPVAIVNLGHADPPTLPVMLPENLEVSA